MNQATRIIALTGGTSGIGLATVEELLSRGHTIIAVGRDAQRCRAAERSLGDRYPEARVYYVVADLATTTAVRRAAAEIAELAATLQSAGAGGRLDALINNAAFVSTWRQVTEEGYEKQFAVNQLAPFLLTRELLQTIQQGRPGRVICVSSGSHRRTRMKWDDLMLTRGYRALRAYRQSKLANVLFCAELNRRTEGSPVTAYAFDPGLVSTEIGLKSLTGVERLVWRLRSRSRGAVDPGVPAGHLADLATAGEIVEPGELYRFRGTPASADPAGLDPLSGARLWAISEELCGARATEAP